MSILHREIVRAPITHIERPVAEPVGRRAKIALDSFVTLLKSVHQAVPNRQACMVEVISSHDGEGVSTVCSGLVRAATVAGEHKALICHVGALSDGFKVLNGGAPVATLVDVALDRAQLRDVFLDVPSEKYSICSLCGPKEANWLAINLHMLDATFEALREQFDLIVVNACSLKHGALGKALTQMVDGVLLVVEAERTRAPTALDARHAIESVGGKILGVVLNKRRFHVPGFIYRRL